MDEKKILYSKEDKIKRDSRDLKRKMKITSTGSYTELVALAIAKDETKNHLVSIPAEIGEPIGSETHDLIRDVYYLECSEWLMLGNIPMGYSMTIEGVHDWEVCVPMPLPVLKRYMSVEQLDMFRKWRADHPSEDFYIKFLQMKSVY